MNKLFAATIFSLSLLTAAPAFAGPQPSPSELDGIVADISRDYVDMGYAVGYTSATPLGRTIVVTIRVDRGDSSVTIQKECHKTANRWPCVDVKD